MVDPIFFLEYFRCFGQWPQQIVKILGILIEIVLEKICLDQSNPGNPKFLLQIVKQHFCFVQEICCPNDLGVPRVAPRVADVFDI